jgi:hypothetical protein
MLERMDNGLAISGVRQVAIKEPEPQSAGRIWRDATRHRRLQNVFAHCQTLDAHQDPRRPGHRNPNALLGVLGDPSNKADRTSVRPRDLPESAALVYPEALVEADPKPPGMILE